MIPGQPGGAATFKWSRENDVGSRVASMVSATELELETLGRDDVLRFNTGDWVEIIDDAGSSRKRPARCGASPSSKRLGASSSRPRFRRDAAGELPRQRSSRRAICAYAAGTRTERCSAPTPAARRSRCRISTRPDSTGVINVPAAGTTLLLENGVTVSFASTGAAGFRTGDYWAFAARTADARSRILDRAPPRGIHHHYARLGIWDVAAGTVTDCRHPWPPQGDGHDCSCTACVTRESHASGKFTIQDAVNQVRETGGTVCLGPGRYVLKGAVTVNQAKSVRIVGKGPATLLLAPAGAFAIQDSFAIVIEDLAIISLNSAPAVDVSTCIGLGLSRLVIAAWVAGMHLSRQ